MCGVEAMETHALVLVVIGVGLNLLTISAVLRSAPDHSPSDDQQLRALLVVGGGIDWFNL